MLLFLVAVAVLPGCTFLQTLAYGYGFDTPMERKAWAAKEKQDVLDYAAQKGLKN